MSDSLSYHFWNSGVVIRHNEEYEKIEGVDDGVIMHLKSGKKLKADCLLYANGRTGNTDTLALENIGLQTDSRGQLKVNSMYQTALPHIYAVGDVIGYPSLASAAYDQGRIAAQALVKGEASAHLIEDIPTGIYTIPEISSVGKTEQQLTAMKVPYEVGRAQFKHLARAQIVGMSVGTLKDPVPSGRPRRSSAFTALANAQPKSFTSARRSWSRKVVVTPLSTSSTPPLTTRPWRKRIGLPR
ncbi:FAD-dependent oxidoreductase [Klebsiella variicola subsp. variicola]|nr:FAD-dependent oxidoreductase [Klebsiella variicola subsp. variicola]